MARSAHGTSRPARRYGRRSGPMRARSCTSPAWLPSAALVVLVESRRHVAHLGRGTGRERGALVDARVAAVTALAPGAAGSVLTGDSAGGVCVWEAATVRCAHGPWTRARWARSCARVEDDRVGEALGLSAGSDGALCLWESPTGRLVRRASRTLAGCGARRLAPRPRRLLRGGARRDDRPLVRAGTRAGARFPTCNS